MAIVVGKVGSVFDTLKNEFMHEFVNKIKFIFIFFTAINKKQKTIKIKLFVFEIVPKYNFKFQKYLKLNQNIFLH